MVDLHMLPDPQHSPACIGQCSVHAPVALDVPQQLWNPVLAIALWDLLVIWAPMPEASVDEHCQPASSEHDVRAHAHSIDSEQQVLPEPMPSVMECGPQADLGPRVGPPIGLADLRRSRISRLRVRHDVPASEVHRARLRSVVLLRFSRVVPGRCHGLRVYRPRRRMTRRLQVSERSSSSLLHVQAEYCRTFELELTEAQ